MTKTAIATRDKVMRACTELALDGRAITFEAVIEKLGGGSNTTIAPHLREWQAAMKGHVTGLTPLPEAVDTAAAKAVATIFDASRTHFENHLRIQKAGHQAQLAELQAQLDQTDRENSTLRDANQRLTNELHEMKEAIDRHDEQTKETQKDSAFNRSRIRQLKREIRILRDERKQQNQKPSRLRMERQLWESSTQNWLSPD